MSAPGQELSFTIDPENQIIRVSLQLEIEGNQLVFWKATSKVPFRQEG